MDWMNQLGGLLQQYSGAQPSQAPDTVQDDFDQLAQTAPQSALSDGLAAAFRSDQTPTVGHMVAQMFAGARTSSARVSSHAVGALGPTVLAQLLSQRRRVGRSSARRPKGSDPGAGRASFARYGREDCGRGGTERPFDHRPRQRLLFRAPDLDQNPGLCGSDNRSRQNRPETVKERQRSGGNRTGLKAVIHLTSAFSLFAFGLLRLIPVRAGRSN